MTSLDDLERVERELRIEAIRLAACGYASDTASSHRVNDHADTIAAFVREQREREENMLALAEAVNQRIAKLRAEVAKLRAACAHKDVALRYVEASGAMPVDATEIVRNAMADDANKGWIDATRAVEATADHGCIDGSGVLVSVNVPDDWAGATVTIVRGRK